METSVAEFVDVDNAPTTALIRHDLMVGKTDTTIVSIVKELELDKELGLKKQVELTVIKALNHDIDELTSSRDYFEVSQSLLEKLFQIKKLRIMCLWTNCLNRVIGFLKAGILPLSLHALMLVSLYPLLRFSMWIWPVTTKAPTPLLVTICIIDCILWIGIVVLLILGFIAWGDKSIEYVSLDVEIESKLLSSISEKIPYGAKLKVIEAKKTGIFKDFIYVSPEFHVKKMSHKITFSTVDPAILGVTTDNRKYMIVYWDIDKDVAKIVKEIEHFKKFKLNKTKII